MPEEIYDPRERLEIFLNAVRTGDVEGLPDPQTREEMYLAAIAGKSALPDTTDAAVGDALVIDSDKKPVWATAGAKKYLHNIKIVSGTTYISFAFINEVETAYTSITNVGKALYAIYGDHDIPANGYITNRIITYLHSQNANGTYFSLIGVNITFDNGTLTMTPNSSYNFTPSGSIIDDVISI